MSSIYEKIDNRIETFLSTLKRFPLASFSAFLLTVIILVLMDYNDHSNPNAIMASKIAFVSTLGIFLFPALQLLGRSFFFPLLGLVLLGLYYYLLPHNIDNANDIIIIRHFLLALALFFMILWSPFVGRKNENDTFWQYAQTVIFGLIISIFFAAIVYAGLAAALYAVEKLFGFDVQSIRYGQLGLIVFGIFGINFFLSQIPKHPLFMQVRPYSKIKRIFSKNILAPIAIVYFLILYAYTAKILMSMSYPSGTLSWIIVAFSFVAIVSFLFLSPYLKKSSLTQRFIWLAIFLQTLMLGMALWIRVEEYGITYNRYLLALFGLWLVLMSLYFMLFGKAQQKWLFFFATLFILFSQFGTYSAKNVTQNSQTARLVQLIATADPRSEELDMKRKYEISDGITYMYEHYGEDAFEKIIPHILKKYQEANTSSIYFTNFATQELGFKYINYWEWNNFQRNGKRQNKHYFTQHDREKFVRDIRAYDWLIDFHTYPKQNKIQMINKENNLSIQFKVKSFFIQDNNETSIQIELDDFIQNLMEKHKQDFNLPSEQMTFVKDDKRIRIKIKFSTLTLSHEGKIENFNVEILLKIKKPKPQPFISPYLKPTPLIIRNLNKKE